MSSRQWHIRRLGPSDAAEACEIVRLFKGGQVRLDYTWPASWGSRSRRTERTALAHFEGTWRNPARGCIRPSREKPGLFIRFWRNF